ncbi:Bacterial transferase hexapeptide repeat-containing protein, partial [Cynara cardunculus var. scolymus]
GVTIGPFCSVGSSTKLGNDCKLHPGSHVFGNTELGDKCILMSGAVVGENIPGRTIIGCNNVIGHHAVIGLKCQDMKYKVIGNNNLIMGSCHIAHDCKVGSNNIFANNTLLAGHVLVEIRSLRAAYRKIFMPTSANLGGIEDRLVEVECHEDLSLVPAVLSLVQSIRESLGEDRRGICKFRSWSFS